MNLCSMCKPFLQKIEQACVICRRPMSTNTKCGECLHNPPAFNQVVCDYLYKAPIDTLIMRYKYHDQLMLCTFLAYLLGEAIEKHY